MAVVHFSVWFCHNDFNNHKFLSWLNPNHLSRPPILIPHAQFSLIRAKNFFSSPLLKGYFGTENGGDNRTSTAYNILNILFPKTNKWIVVVCKLLETFYRYMSAKFNCMVLFLNENMMAVVSFLVDDWRFASRLKLFMCILLPLAWRVISCWRVFDPCSIHGFHVKLVDLFMPAVFKPWVAAYFGVGQRNDNGSHGSPTDLNIYIGMYIYRIGY